jgi:hypothetical protein
VRPSTGVTVQEENLHCGFVRYRRMDLFNLLAPEFFKFF